MIREPALGALGALGWGRDAGALAALLRALPPTTSARGAGPLPEPGGMRAHLLEAERHGLAGVVLDGLRARGVVLDSEVATTLDLREAARGADHLAHLALLARIDDALSRAGLRGVALKGPLFAERYYARPSSRATTDIDLLVSFDRLEDASAVLEELGYVRNVGPEEDRFRREHHHVHLLHPETPPLELHFHAFTAFGRVLPSDPLLERSRAAPLPSVRALRVLAPEDELVFLAVHAAAHRVVRLGWLYDLSLVLRAIPQEAVKAAATRARAWGFARATAFALSLVVELFALPPALLEPLEAVGAVRRGVARLTVGEPRNGAVRSATRLAYTAALCDDRQAALRYALRASRGHARRLLGWAG